MCIYAGAHMFIYIIGWGILYIFKNMCKRVLFLQKFVYLCVNKNEKDMITTVTVTVTRGRRQGTVKVFTGTNALIKACNYCDKLDNEYGAICTIKKCI